MEFSRWKNLLVALAMASILTSGVAFVLHNKNYLGNQVSAISYNQDITNVAETPPPPPQKLSNPPTIIKSVYVTGYSAGSKRYLNYLSNLFKNTQINAVVVDIKGSDGYVTYASGAGDVKKYNLTNFAISDIDTLVRFFHDQNIYVIGRIAVFEDPVYAKARPNLAIYSKAQAACIEDIRPSSVEAPCQKVLWQDNNGLQWLDPASKDVWDYDISLAKDAFLYHGFDEINFDYVRFPSDGKTSNMGFPVYDKKMPMADVMKTFFHYVRTNLINDKISVDLFGLTTVSTDDMGIGQVIENAFENFDYVSPMVYPSHYADGFIGFANPAEHPYEVIKYSMDHALAKENVFLQNEQTPVLLSKFRPWIQDFNMGAIYDANMIDQEIKATQDSLGNDFVGFMLWNPNNIYIQSAILK